MKRKLSIVILSVMLVLSGCGSSDTSISYNNYDTDNMMTTEAFNDYNYESVKSYDDSYDEPSNTSYDDRSEADIVKQSMMIARDARISVDVQNLEEFDFNVSKRVDELGGYYESSEINGYSTSYSEERYGYFTIRIPAENLDKFIGEVSDSGNVTFKNVSAEDVSLQYVDVEAHLDSLRNEKAAFEKLLDNAYTVDEIMNVQDRISQLQAQIDSYERQRRILSGRVSYSTVNITAVERRDIDHPVREAFSIKFGERLLEGVESAVNIAVNIIVTIPSIIVIGFFVVIAILIIRRIKKSITGEQRLFVKKDKKNKIEKDSNEVNTDEQKTQD